MSPFHRNHKSIRKERPIPVKLLRNILFVAAFAALALCTLAVAQDAAPAAPAIEDASEATLIGIIQGDAPYVDKLKACRGLRIRGTAAAVPALAAMLPNPELSHIARYALEPMPCPQAGKALRDAVAKTAGKAKAGLAASLGVRRDPDAVPVLTPLLNDADAEVAQAAAAALGRIATPTAVDTLFKCYADGPDAIQPAIADGLLAAAQHLAASDAEAAAAIYEKLAGPEWPEFVRTGAFYGLAAAKPAQAPQRLIAALRADDPLFRNIAAAIVGETSGDGNTPLYADTLPSLPPDGQIALVRGLMARKDPLARPAVTTAAQSSDPAVKAAAVKALSVLGSPDDVPMLAALLDNADPVLADAANYALTFMQGDGVNNGIASAAGSSPAPVRAKLIELLANRRAEQDLPIAVANLTDTDAAVRLAALKALQPIAGQDQSATLLQALAKAADETERTAAERALVAVAGRTGDSLLPALIDAIKKADADSSVALLHVIARIGNQQALETILGALKSKKDPVREEAVRVLSDWPTLDAAPHLLEFAKSNELSRQVLGLRGYVRLVGIEPSSENKIKMLNNAMALARRPEEKKVVVGAWAAVFATQSLDALCPSLDDPDVQNEAAAAILAVAPEIAKNPAAQSAAIDALNLVIQKSPNTSLREKAQNILAAIQ